MKTYKNILVQIVFLLSLSHLSFSQEVEVNLGGNSPSDAFVVRDSSGNVLLRMDGDKNFGINSEQPDGIEIRGREGTYGIIPGSVSIIGGSGYPYTGGSVNINGGYGNNGGNIDIKSGAGVNNGGDINIHTDDGNYGGNINIYTGPSNNGQGGSIALTAINSGNITLTTEEYGDIVLSSGSGLQLETTGNLEDGDDITLKTGFSDSGENNIWLTVGGCDGTEDCPRGIILNPNVGLVEIIGSGTYTGTWTQASDKRYKSNIKHLSGILNKVNLLQPVEYEWNKEEYPEQNFPDGNQIGLIAQEVEKLFPEMVATNKDGYKSIDYSKISVLLIQAMKEQQNEIDKMKSELEELKSIIMQDSNKFSSNDNQQEVE